MEERICEKKWVFSLEWKAKVEIYGVSEGGDCDDVISVGWGEPREWTEWGWQNEEGSWFHR